MRAFVAGATGAIGRQLVPRLVAAGHEVHGMTRGEVNGGPGVVYLDAQRRLVGVVALDIAGGQIASVSSIVNPDKLAHLGPVGDLTSLRTSAT